MMSLLLLILASGADAAVLTVCASGCTHTAVSAAVAAASSGDVIEIEAGSVFPADSIWIMGIDNLTIRSSRWRELPPAGVRIDPVAHDALLATLETSTVSGSLRVGSNENNVTDVDTSADTLTFGYADPPFRVSANAEISCSIDDQSKNNTAMPAPLVHGQKYWVQSIVDPTPGALKVKLSLTRGGPPIDLTTTGSATSTNYYERPQCFLWAQPVGIKLQGLRIRPQLGTTAPRHLIRVGNSANPSPNEGPSVTVDHCVLTGWQNDTTGPYTGLALLSGRNHVLTDSWLGHLKNTAAQDSTAVTLLNLNGARIENNYLSGATEIVITGGEVSAGGSIRNVQILGNFLEKPGYMMYKEGDGAPSGACYYGGGSGAFYRDTAPSPNTCANGACYTCQSGGTWALDTGAFYRDTHYFTKNLLEFKDCEDCRVEGNKLVGSYQGPDAGQPECLSISVIVTVPGNFGGSGKQSRAKHVKWIGNHADRCYGGIKMAARSDDTTGSWTYTQHPVQSVGWINNLMTNVGEFPALSKFPDVGATGPEIVGFRFSTAGQGMQVSNNSIIPAPGRETSYGMFLYATYGWPDIVGRNAWFANNLVPGGTSNEMANVNNLPVGASNDCTSANGLAQVFDSTHTSMSNNVFFATAATGGSQWLSNANCNTYSGPRAFHSSIAPVGFSGTSLGSSSPYSAQNGTPTFLSTGRPEVAGRSVGADVRMLEQYTIPASAGRASYPEQLRLRARQGSTAAVIEFDRPAGQTCLVKIYTDAARLALHADTANAGLQADDRASSIVTGDHVQFAVGASSALTANTLYHYDVACGSGPYAVGYLRTLVASGATQTAAFTLRSATATTATIEHSASSSFTSPTSATVNFSGGLATARISMPAGLRYVRGNYTDGSVPARIYVAP